MSDFKVREFLDRLHGLGLMLSASRLPDGSVRLNQWRLMNYYENEAQIKMIWSTYVGSSDERIQDIIRHLEIVGRAPLALSA